MKKFAKKILLLKLYFLRNFLNFFFDFKEVSVLGYHSVSDEGAQTSVSRENFERQIKFLKNKNYYFASLGEIADYIKGSRDLPQKTVALTFDDGYQSVFDNALPVLSQHKIPATVFMVSGAEEAMPTGQTSIKNFGNDLTLLNSEQILKMKEAGIKFEGHSKTHRMLDGLPIGEVRKEVERNNCDYFAYPGGHSSKEAIEAVKEAGYKGAFSIRPGLVRKGDDLFYIKRNVILGEMSLGEFKARVTKAVEGYQKIVRFFKN